MVNEVNFKYNIFTGSLKYIKYLIQIFLFFSFLFGGLLCYLHWEAMLTSYLAMRVIRVPFSNMQELYESDYRLSTEFETSNWDAFKHGNKLWKNIHRLKLEPITREKSLEYLFMDVENALYANIYEYM